MGDMEVRANDGISLDIYRGEFVSIVGKSGSGKSTIMNIIGALDVPTEGKYILNGQDVSEMEDDSLADLVEDHWVVFTDTTCSPSRTSWKNAGAAPDLCGSGKRSAQSARWNRWKRVGLRDKWRYMPQQLSGGQQQRVSIARALVGNPSLILGGRTHRRIGFQNGPEAGLPQAAA